MAIFLCFLLCIGHIWPWQAENKNPGAKIINNALEKNLIVIWRCVRVSEISQKAPVSVLVSISLFTEHLNTSYIILIVNMEKCLLSDWSRRVQYMSYCALNVALCKLRKIMYNMLKIFKVGLSSSKKNLHDLLYWKAFKSVEKCVKNVFYFISKALFVLKILLSFCHDVLVM